jgi:hypothetical protein
MKTKHTLESVLADFQLWRQNKTSPRSRIPENLKHNAVALLADLSPGKITKTLGISRSMLTTWGLQQGQSSDTASAIKFVALPVEPPTETNDCNDLTLSLTQSNGNHWCLQGSVSASQLNVFIQMAGSVQ